jgi:CRISPR/Cas system CMR-associated protein Cmr3 (group 5 of RAMP superfamily)
MDNMEIQQFKTLLNNPEYLAFEQFVKWEIASAEKKAIQSILSDKIDIENANRAKFYTELLAIPRNKISANKMNDNKTKL